LYDQLKRVLWKTVFARAAGTVFDRCVFLCERTIKRIARVFQDVVETRSDRRLLGEPLDSASMKVSPQSSPLTATEQEDGPRHHSDDSDAANNCGSKRRRLHSQTNTIDNHLRHRKHVYPRHDNRSTTSTGCFDDSNSSCSSGNGGGDASDCDDSSNVPAANSHPVKQRPAEEGTSSSPPPPSRHNKKVRYIMTRDASQVIRMHTHT